MWIDRMTPLDIDVEFAGKAASAESHEIFNLLQFLSHKLSATHVRWHRFVVA